MQNSTMVTNSTTAAEYTTYNPDRIESYRIEWIVSDSLAIPLALLDLYIIASQTAYLILKKKSQQRERIANGKRRTEGASRSNMRYSMFILPLCIFAAVFAFVRVGFDLRLIYGRNDSYWCTATIKMKTVGYALSLLAVYLVLWIRQRIFYNDVRLKHMSSKFIRAISWFISILFVTSGLTTLTLFLVSGEYLGTPYGCLSLEGRLDNIRYKLLITSTVFFQFFFLSLFIYPLVKHQKTMKHFSAESKENPIVKLIMRATVSTSICIVTDAACLAIATPLDRYGSAQILVYDVNIVINVVSLIVSFADWRERFMPWRLNKTIKKTETDIQNHELNHVDTVMGNATKESII